MNYSIRKYKSLLSVTGIVYLYFYLAFPLFHQHGLVDNNSLENEKYHSHLVNEQHEHPDEHHEDHHSIDDFSKHQHHFVKFNSIDSNSAKRILTYFPVKIILNSNSSVIKIESLLSVVKFLPEINLQWEKCVHSAANVSPPIA